MKLNFSCLALDQLNVVSAIQYLTREKMNKVQRESYKVRILKLADLKSTGTPAELGSKFDISARSIKRLVMEIRAEGKDISYCHVRRSYITESSS